MDVVSSVGVGVGGRHLGVQDVLLVFAFAVLHRVVCLLDLVLHCVGDVVISAGNE